MAGFVESREANDRATGADTIVYPRVDEAPCISGRELGEAAKIHTSVWGSAVAVADVAGECRFVVDSHGLAPSLPVGQRSSTHP